MSDSAPAGASASASTVGSVSSASATAALQSSAEMAGLPSAGCHFCSPVSGSVIHSPSAQSWSSYAASSATWVSDRMSMRQPVIRAANRAFWPSFPIASDS